VTMLVTMLVRMSSRPLAGAHVLAGATPAGQGTAGRL